MPKKLAFLPSRRCGKTASTCEGCSMPWNRLFDTFVNGLGWRRLCAKCSDPTPSAPRPAAYPGPYPIRSATTLRVIDGGAV